MTDIKFKCTQCEQNLAAPAGFAGQTINCPACSTSITVPQADEQPKKGMTITIPKMEINSPYLPPRTKPTSQKTPPPAPTPTNLLIMPLFLFWLLLGPFGAHFFYAGKPRMGALCIILLLTSWLIVPAVALCIIQIVSLIQILCGNFTDATGRKITQWT